MTLYKSKRCLHTQQTNIVKGTLYNTYTVYLGRPIIFLN